MYIFLKGSVGISHPTLYKLIDQFRKEQHSVQLRISRQNVFVRNKRQLDKDDLLKRKLLMFDLKDLDNYFTDIMAILE